MARNVTSTAPAVELHDDPQQGTGERGRDVYGSQAEVGMTLEDAGRGQTSRDFS